MKIAYLTPTYPPYPGGMGVVAYYSAHEMARRGHEVHVFTPAYAGVKFPISNFQFPTLHALRPWVRYGNAGFLPQLLWKLKGFDIVHGYYPFFGGLEIAALAKKHARFSLVLHHEMDTEGQGVFKMIFKKHTQWCLPFIFRNTDRFLILSEDYFDHSPIAPLWKKYGRSEAKVVPNGVDTKKFVYDPVKKLNTPPTLVLVAGLDRAHYFKGVPVLLRAIKILTDKGMAMRVKIIGEGDLRPEYETLSHELGLSGHVTFTGLVTHDHLPDELARADLFVLPSVGITESFCVAAAEGMACGVPAIVTDLPGMRVTIEDGVTGFLCKKNDEKDLALKIERILSDPALWARMSGAARKRMEEKFSWERIGATLEKIYSEINPT